MTALQYGVDCAVGECHWSVLGSTDDDATIDLVNWHVYREHPETWAAACGGYVPRDPYETKPG